MFSFFSLLGIKMEKGKQYKPLQMKKKYFYLVTLKASWYKNSNAKLLNLWVGLYIKYQAFVTESK